MEVQAFYVVPTDIALGGSLLLLVSNKVLTPTWPFLIYPGRGIGVFCYRRWESRLSTWPFFDVGGRGHKCFSVVLK